MKTERIHCSTVTDALMKAMEHADDMEDVVVLYYAKDGCRGSMFCSENMKASDLLWLLEQVKAYILGLEQRGN